MSLFSWLNYRHVSILGVCLPWCTCENNLNQSLEFYRTSYLYVFQACDESTICNESLEDILPCSGHFVLENKGSMLFKQMKQFKKRWLSSHFLAVCATNLYQKYDLQTKFCSIRDIFDFSFACRKRRVFIRCFKTRRRCVIISNVTWRPYKLCYMYIQRFLSLLKNDFRSCYLTLGSCLIRELRTQPRPAKIQEHPV